MSNLDLHLLSLINVIFIYVEWVYPHFPIIETCTSLLSEVRSSIFLRKSPPLAQISHWKCHREMGFAHPFLVQIFLEGSIQSQVQTSYLRVILMFSLNNDNWYNHEYLWVFNEKKISNLSSCSPLNITPKKQNKIKWIKTEAILQYLFT